MTIGRYLCGYDRDGDTRREMRPLPENITLEILQKIFDEDADDPMLEAYHITPAIAQKFKAYGVDIAMESLDYFLHAFEE